MNDCSLNADAVCWWYGMCTIVIKMLRGEPDAKVAVPGIEVIEGYKAILKERHPHLEDVWCCMDGLKLYLE